MLMMCIFLRKTINVRTYLLCKQRDRVFAGLPADRESTRSDRKWHKLMDAHFRNVESLVVLPTNC